MNEKYESIKRKLRKLKALADAECVNEAEAARRVIDRLCATYGIRLEDVLDSEKKQRYRFEIGQGHDMMNLFIRCLEQIVGDIAGMKYSRPTRASIRIEVTALQYAEIRNLFDWHRENFRLELRKMQNNFVDAYIMKHGLYFQSEREGGNGKERDEITQEELESIRRIMALRDTMSDVYYHKQLEAHGQ